MLDFPFFLSPVNSTGEAGETTDNEVLMAVLHSSPAIIQVVQLCARSGTVLKILVKLGLLSQLSGFLAYNGRRIC